MGKLFRLKSPIRTYNGEVKANYRDYKSFLISDFNNRCGYSDCSDMWFGGRDNFHIDHFIPWKKHPEKPDLKTDYANLVYSCSYINILKSDDEGNYLDPCQVDYNQHFSRDNNGFICPNIKSQKSIYMYKKLKLYLKRYQIIWILDNVYNRMLKIARILDKDNIFSEQDDLRKLQSELSIYFVEYMECLQKIQ